MFQSVLRFVGLYFLGGTLSVALRLRVKAMFLAVVFAIVSGQGVSMRALCGGGPANRLCERFFVPWRIAADMLAVTLSSLPFARSLARSRTL